jgi:transcriptional regulator with PAS, ATPase and Fis domain
LGPGKEFLSRYTHQQTKRVPKPFILGLLQLALGSNPIEMEWKKLNLSYRKIYTTTTTILLNEWNIVPSGPGKEFLSRYTHQQTKRDPQPFILGLLQLALGSNPLEIE